MKTGNEEPSPVNGDVASRLREFAKLKYNSVSGLCRALGKDTSFLNLYLSGKSLPGWKLQQRLRELGCDIEWLMTGNETTNMKLARPTKDPFDNEFSITSDDVTLLKAALLRMLKQMNVMELELESKNQEIRVLKSKLS